MIEHWRVQVDINGDMAIAIETNILCGKDLSDDEQDVVQHCAEHLLAFLGRTAEIKEPETQRTTDKGLPF
jgi:hypothetical protein